MKMQLNHLETNISYISIIDIIEETAKSISQFIRLQNASSFLADCFMESLVDCLIFYFFIIDL